MPEKKKRQRFGGSWRRSVRKGREQSERKMKGNNGREWSERRARHKPSSKNSSNYEGEWRSVRGREHKKRQTKR